MSLFDSFRKSTLEKTFSPEEAANGILLAVIFSDGAVSAEEVETYQLAATRHPLFRHQTTPDFNRMMDNQIEIIRHHGWMKLVEKSAEDLPTNLRATLFALAVDFVLADGRVDAAEERLIDRIRELLAIDPADAETVVAVLCAKNGVN
ncbi:MAG: tellurite resistance TerB family protein [Paracoccus sp. (in: a-proteobacteria)]